MAELPSELLQGGCEIGGQLGRKRDLRLLEAGRRDGLVFLARRDQFLAQRKLHAQIERQLNLPFDRNGRIDPFRFFAVDVGGSPDAPRR